MRRNPSLRPFGHRAPAWNPAPARTIPASRTPRPLPTTPLPPVARALAGPGRAPAPPRSRARRPFTLGGLPVPDTHRPARRRPQRTVRWLEALLVHLLKSGEVVGQHPVERRGLGPAWTVGRRAPGGARRGGGPGSRSLHARQRASRSVPDCAARAMRAADDVRPGHGSTPLPVGVGGAPRPSPESIRASGETFPVSCPFKCPRMPEDARAFPGQLLAVLCNTLRDNRFMLAAVRVS